MRGGGLRAIGYVRCSTVEQGQSGAGIAAQKRKIVALAELHGLDLEIREDVVSAKTLARPALAVILDEIRGGADVGALVVAKLDRLTRSVRDLEALIELLEAKGVRLISASESIDTGSAAGRMVLRMLGTIAQWEREIIAERTSEALAARRAAGRRAGNVPFGFSADDDGRLVGNDNERALVAEARDRKSQGQSLRAIAAALNAAGHRTRAGGEWSHVGVRTSLLPAGC